MTDYSWNEHSAWDGGSDWGAGTDWSGGTGAMDWGQASDDLLDMSQTAAGNSGWLQLEAYEAWNQGDIDGYHDLWQMSCDQGDMSQQLEDLSWQAWYGPVNADGYTAMDVSHGYSATDTSFIEPASSAGSVSMISDQSGESFL